MAGCRGKIPVTVQGQEWNDYLKGEGEKGKHEIHGRWKLKSLSDDIAPYNISLYETPLLLQLTAEMDTSGYHVRGINIRKRFWGTYQFDEEGNIKFQKIESPSQSMELWRSPSGNYGIVAERFMKGITEARHYTLEDSELLLISEQEVLRFGRD